MLTKSTSRRVVEDRVRAVAVVHVPVEHQHPLGTQRVEGVPRRDRNVREQAEAERPRPLGVVPGRPQRREAGALAAGEQRLGERAGPARGAQGGLVGARAGGRVQVERLASRAHVAHARRCTPPDAPAAAAPRWPRAPRVAPTRATRGSRAPPRSRGSCRAAPDGRGRCRAPARPGGGRTAACAPVRYLRAVDEPLRTDVAVVGAGAAGLYAALVAADQGASVALVSRSPLAQTASYWAQGGIAAALAPDDSPARHAADTLAAGRDAARESAVRVLCEESPDARARPSGARRPVRRRPRRQPRARARGRALRAPDRPRGRRRHRAPNHARALGARGHDTSGSRCLSRSRPPRSPRTRAAAPVSPLRSRDGRPFTRLGPRGDPRHRRHGRSVAAHHEPARGGRIRAQPGQRGGRASWPTSSSCSSTRRRSGSTGRATASS